MACGGCQKRREAQSVQAADNRQAKEEQDLMGGYANLTDRQIKARLEIYKRRYCGPCAKRYECDYTVYTECRKNENIK
jgi:hypothetical protein